MQGDQHEVVPLADLDGPLSHQRSAIAAREYQLRQALNGKKADDRVERAHGKRDDLQLDCNTRNPTEKPGPRLVTKCRFGVCSLRVRSRTNITVAADMLP